MSKKEKQISEAYLEKVLTEVLKAEMDKVPEVHITPEELEAWAAADNVKRRKRRS